MSDTGTGPPSTGGADLGAMGQLHGRMPGLRGLTTLGADVAALGAERWYLNRRNRKPAKDYNDQPGDTTVGTEDGNAVKEAPSEFKSVESPSPFPVP